MLHLRYHFISKHKKQDVYDPQPHFLPPAASPLCFPINVKLLGAFPCFIYFLLLIYAHKILSALLAESPVPRME